MTPTKRELEKAFNLLAKRLYPHNCSACPFDKCWYTDSRNIGKDCVVAIKSHFLKLAKEKR